MSARQPLGSRLRRPDRCRRNRRARLDRLLLRQLLPARRHHQLSPKQGVVVQNEGGGWSHIAITMTPGIPGDSGSGFFNGSGEAFGVLSTLQIAPLTGTNGVGGLGKELAYMRATSFSAMQLVAGTDPSNRTWLRRSSAPKRPAPVRRGDRVGEAVRDHGDFLAAGRARPLLTRPVPIELDPVAVGIAEVERLADAVVGGALEGDARR